MTIAELIKNWEDSGDSFKALEILKRIDPSFAERYKGLMSLSFSQKSEINFQLRKFSEDLTEISESKPIPPVTTPTKSPTKKNIEFIPEEVQFYKNKGKYLNKLYARKHALLSMESLSDGDRYKIAKEIVTDIIPNISMCYDKISKFEDDGIVPDFEKSTIVSWVNSLHAKRKSNIEKSSRLRAKKKKSSHLEAELLDQQLQLLQDEIKSIDEKLKI